jgi:PAS domain-containing protein
VPVLLGAARLARAPFTCVCFVQDLSERKRSEAALRANQKQWEVLVQTAPAAIVIHGADGKLLRCNSVAERLLGLSQPRAAGKTLNARAWHFLREDGTPMPVEEYPVALVLKQKTPLSNYICGIRHAEKKNGLGAGQCPAALRRGRRAGGCHRGVH